MKKIKRILVILLLIIVGNGIKKIKASANYFEWNIVEITIPLNSNFEAYLSSFEPKFIYNGKKTNEKVTVELDPLYYGSLTVDTTKVCDKQVSLLAYVSGYTNYERKSIIVHIKDDELPEIKNIKELVIDYGSEFNVSSYFSITDNDKLDEKTISYDFNPNELSVIGSHKIVVSASDVSGNHTVKEYEYVVKDYSNPVLNVASNIEIEYGDLEFDIKDFAQAYDILDGDITSSITDTGLDVYKLGKQTITISVKDSQSNLVEIKKEVTVVDLKAPILELSTYKTSIDISDIDNIDFKSFIETAKDECSNLSPSDVSIDASEFLKKVGSYNVYYYLKDDAKNYVKRVLSVDVRFSEPPIIEASNLEFMQGESFDLKQYIKVSSKYDKNVVDNYYIDDIVLNRDVPGTYEVIIDALDYAGNETEKKIYVTIKSKDEYGVKQTSQNLYKFFYEHKLIFIIGIIAIFVFIYLALKKKHNKLGM